LGKAISGLQSGFQGGMLLAQVADDVAPLEDALRAATGQVRTFAVPPDAGQRT
jgi:hypothetical protein